MDLTLTQTRPDPSSYHQRWRNIGFKDEIHPNYRSATCTYFLVMGSGTRPAFAATTGPQSQIFFFFTIKIVLEGRKQINNVLFWLWIVLEFSRCGHFKFTRFYTQN